MGSGGGTQTVSNEPWGPLQPQLLGYAGASNDWFYGPQGNPYTNAPQWQGGTGGQGQQIQGNLGRLGFSSTMGTPTSFQMGASPSGTQTNPTTAAPARMRTAGQPWVSPGDTGSPSPADTASMPWQGGGATTPQTPTLPPYGDRTSWMNQPMVAGLAPQTTQAWDMATQRATNGSPVMQGANSLAQGVMGSSYTSADPSMSMFQGLGNQAMQNPAMSGFQNFNNSALEQTARGDFLNQQNPAFQAGVRQIGNAFNDITMPGIASQFGAAGRTGSGAQALAAGRASEGLAGQLSSLWGNTYNQERQNQIGAAGTLGGQQLQALGGLSGAYGTGIGQQLQAAGGVGQGYQGAAGRQMQAMGMAPTLANQDYQDLGQLLNVGQMQQGYNQQLIDAPYNRLVQYGALMQPGMGFNNKTQPLYGGSNPILTGLGGAGTGYMIGGPYGAAAGGLLGLLGGMQR